MEKQMNRLAFRPICYLSMKKQQQPMKQPYATAVILYKQIPAESEILSFKQCLKILGNHPVILIAPSSLSLSYYMQMIENQNVDVNVTIVRFDDAHFASIDTYNKLLLSVEFYRKFMEYENILLYQLDAFIFTDDIKKWCSMGYDYIGAPWFEGRDQATEQSQMLPYAGNGGFSLRNIEALIRILTENKHRYVLKMNDILTKYRTRSLLYKLTRIPKIIARRWSLENRYDRFFDRYLLDGKNEDIFFSLYAPKINPAFKVAPPDIAMKFAFECLPGKLYAMNGNRLPMGCHAWCRYEPDFWRPFIEEFGFRTDSIESP